MSYFYKLGQYAEYSKALQYASPGLQSVMSRFNKYMSNQSSLLQLQKWYEMMRGKIKRMDARQWGSAPNIVKPPGQYTLGTMNHKPKLVDRGGEAKRKALKNLETQYNMQALKMKAGLLG